MENLESDRKEVDELSGDHSVITETASTVSGISGVESEKSENVCVSVSDGAQSTSESSVGVSDGAQSKYESSGSDGAQLLCQSKSAADETSGGVSDVVTQPNAESSLLGWGQSGALGGPEDSDRRIVPLLSDRQIVNVQSKKHTLFLTDAGAVLSCGSNNEYGQIGRDGACSIPKIVSSLDAFVVVSCAVGDDYSLIATSTGSVFSWGRNNVGQLGHGNRADVSKPRLVKGLLQSKVIVQVAAGRSHSLALARTGELFGFGDGCIGNGDVLGSISPVAISHVYGSAVSAIACGESHSMLLTNGGTVWSWGSNSFNQTGVVGPTLYRPNVVKALTGARVKQISCGSFHSLALTDEGRVFVWGKASDGQLGLGDVGANVSNPRVVSELLGTKIVRLAGGRRHSLFLSDQGRVWCAGVPGASLVSSSLPTLMDGVKGVTNVFCGPFASFLRFGGGQPVGGAAGVFFLDEEKIARVERLQENEVNSSVRQELLTLAETAFSFPGSVNGSFLDPGAFFATGGEETPGILCDRALKFMDKLVALGAGEALGTAWSRLIRNNLDNISYKSAENLRVWLLAFFNPAFLRPNDCFAVLDRFLVSLVGLREKQKRILYRWLSLVSQAVFDRCVTVVQRFVSFATSNHATKQKATTGALVLDELRKCRRNLPLDYFYNSSLSSSIDLLHEVQLFRQGPTVFSWLRYPFLLDASAKAKLVELSFKQHALYITLLSVRRQNLLEDVLSQVHQMTNLQLRQPIRVAFVGEEGLDEGGPRRELFQLLLEQILNPDVGLFKFNQKSGKYWFAGDLLQSGSNVLFELIGVLLGLAVSSAVVLNVRFPFLLYEMLCGMSPRNYSAEEMLSRLDEIDSELAKGLRDVLAYDSAEIDALGLTFAVSRPLLGDAMHTVELLPGGAELEVNVANARKYVELYCLFVLRGEIDQNFSAFSKGFMRVMGDNPIFNLLNASEVRLLVEGRGDVQIRLLDLKQKAVYIGYTATDRVIDDFWSVLSSYSREDAKQFLSFCFGSSGIPIQGLSSVRFAIQKSGDDPTRLPASHTCAGVLDLPAYPSREVLASKLEMAMKEGVGFGLI